MTASPTPAELAEALLAAIDGRGRESQAYADGYRDGHRSGWEVGYAHAHHEMAAAWAVLAARVRALADTRTLDERRALDDAAVRGEPCPAACGRCSRCARATAVARRGGDYLGVRAHRGAA